MALTGIAGNKYLLDTVIVAGYFNRDNEILRRIPQYVSAITIGELYYGAYNSEREVQNIGNIETFIQHTSVLTCDIHTSKWYGRIKHQLKTKKVDQFQKTMSGLLQPQCSTV